LWIGLALAAAAVVAYLPALRGPFLFDDLYLPMTVRSVNDPWIVYVKRGVRAVTNLSLLTDYAIWGLNSTAYHVVNLCFHLLNGWLVLRILRKLLIRAGRPENQAAYGAVFGSALFLLHPLQTEAVAYIASRSEVLCAFFAYAACLVFLPSKSADRMGWGRALAILFLLGLGMTSKEPAVAMAGVFLLLDVWFSEGLGVRNVAAKWKLYVPMILGGGAAGAAMIRIVGREGSAGATAGISPLDYLFTQFKAIWVYVQMYVLPFNLNLDHDFPRTKAPGDLLAWLGLLGLIGVVACAWIYRRRYPVATLGALMFLVLLAPTSSILPIADTLADRRVYLGSIGLAAIAAEFVSRMKRDALQISGLIALLAVLCGITAVHAGLYTSALAMWQSSVELNPNNSRAHFHLADAYYQQGRCQESLQHFETAGRLKTPDIRLLVNWGLALDCAGNSEAAVTKLRQATDLNQGSHAWRVLGMILGKRGELAKSMDALNQALKLNPQDENALVYRGDAYLLSGQPLQALADYEEALRLNPSDEAALQGKRTALRAQRAPK